MKTPLGNEGFPMGGTEGEGRRARARAADLVCLLFAMQLVFTAGAAAQTPGGTISGRVFDGDTKAPISGATVILDFPEPEDGSLPPQFVETSGPAGDFEFDVVPVSDAYSLSIVKSGYRASAITGVSVSRGEDTFLEFPMPRQSVSPTGEVLELGDFVVEAGVVGDMMNNLELRLESDQMLNLLSAEDLSKFAASDVADALKRVAGVNIVEGQFAIIRGLEDRYSSTTYNGAPVPSPDPLRQSVQLDLFASEIVGDLAVAKTFAGELASNSAGGSIDILTHSYPDENTATISFGAGFNERALDKFLNFYANNPVGSNTDPVDVVETEYGLSLGGRAEKWNREFRYKFVANREIDYETRDGFQEAREPARGRARRNRVIRNGDLALGELNLSRGRFELTESEETRQFTFFGAGGFDIDEAGHHRIDGSVFRVDASTHVSQSRENGFLPAFDYGSIDRPPDEVTSFDIADVVGGSTLTSPLVQLREEDDPADGIVYYTVLNEYRAFESERSLTLTQLNGEHDELGVDGLTASWVFNWARAEQNESAIGSIIFFEPDDPINQLPASLPATVADIGPGVWAVNNRGIAYNANTVDEEQFFGRFDVEYERQLTKDLDLTLKSGLWFEDSERDVESTVGILIRLPGTTQRSAITDSSPLAVGARVFDEAQLGAGEGSRSNFAPSTVNLTREVAALHFGGKLVALESVDLIASVRLENLEITGSNDPFTGEVVDGSPSIFPSKYLYCDRRDNPAIPFEGVTFVPTDVTFNDQVIGIPSPVDENGILDRVTREEIEACLTPDIDEQLILPSAGFALRPAKLIEGNPKLEAFRGLGLENLTLRAAYSQTAARPSFRELGYYITSDPGTDDLIVGNPQLGISDVESWDVRAEWVWGELGDLVAGSFFVKQIEDPIEVIVLRDAAVVDESIPANYRTFFNNRNGADLLGFEAEARFHLGFDGLFGPASDFLDYISIGGNYTWIDAEVERSDAEIQRTGEFFIANPAEVVIDRYERKRRLFGQPEWIANADVSFDHPDWGTRITLAYFSISEVLNAAGSVSLNAGNEVTSFEPDRYTDEFYQLDLVLGQDFEIPKVPGRFTLGASIKNLTDTTRKIIYDQEQTVDDVRERSFRQGRDYSFSIRYGVEY